MKGVLILKDAQVASVQSRRALSQLTSSVGLVECQPFEKIHDDESVIRVGHCELLLKLFEDLATSAYRGIVERHVDGVSRPRGVGGVGQPTPKRLQQVDALSLPGTTDHNKSAFLLEYLLGEPAVNVLQKLSGKDFQTGEQR